MCLDAIENQEIPGIVALVARHGKIVYQKAFGRVTEDGRISKTDDIFRIASQSKAITSTAVMMLWEEGRFQLDDPISMYIPEFKNPQVLASFRYSDTTYTTIPAEREITIRHLLTHTSGLGYGIIDGDERFKLIYGKAGITDLFTTQPVTIKESVLKLAKLPLHHHPGEKYTYSEGLDVLGYFIEVISGLSFDEFLRTRLFDPLGMNDTYFYLPDSKANRLVAVLKRSDDQWKQYPITFYDTNYPIKGAKSFFSGGAGLSSTAKDYATFLQMYLNGGAANGVRILSRTTIQSILSNQVGELLGDERNYGLAFGLTTADGAAKGGNASAGTFDWGGYFNTQYFADPNEGLIGILMKQTQGPVSDQTSWKFRILVEQAVDD
jgi:CubicO group peptidase (beta-lactamase class C family)